MKKTIITLSALILLASSTVFAQDGDKKQEPKQEPKKEEKKAPGGTRMAINEKGLPGNGTKKGNTSTQKSSTTSTTSTTSEKKEESKK